MKKVTAEIIFTRRNLSGTEMRFRRLSPSSTYRQIAERVLKPVRELVDMGGHGMITYVHHPEWVHLDLEGYNAELLDQDNLIRFQHLAKKISQPVSIRTWRGKLELRVDIHVIVKRLAIKPQHQFLPKALTLS